MQFSSVTWSSSTSNSSLRFRRQCCAPSSGRVTHHCQQVRHAFLVQRFGECVTRVRVARLLLQAKVSPAVLVAVLTGNEFCSCRRRPNPRRDPTPIHSTSQCVPVDASSTNNCRSRGRFFKYRPTRFKWSSSVPSVSACLVPIPSSSMTDLACPATNTPLSSPRYDIVSFAMRSAEETSSKPPPASS